MAVKKLYRGFSLVELLVVLAVSGILLGSTIPLGSHWMKSANLSTVDGEMSHGIGKAIAAALRNEQAVDSMEPAAALCLSDTNQLTVLEANASDLPNCSAGTGKTVWTTSMPSNATITADGSDISCLCFNPYALLTTHNCSSCTTKNTLDLSIGNVKKVLYVR